MESRPIFGRRFEDNDIERVMTYFFKSDVSTSIDFVRGYLKEICLEIGRHIYNKKATGEERVLNVCVKLLSHIHEDFKENSLYYSHEFSTEKKQLHKEGHAECVRRIIFLSACVVVNEKQEKEPYSKITDLLREEHKQFLSAFKAVYDNPDFNNFFYKNISPDRHGASTSSTNSFEFWKRFLVFYIDKYYGDLAFDMRYVGNVEDWRQFELLLETCLGEIKKREGFASSLEELIKIMKKNEQELIISTKLDPERIDDFIKKLETGYERVNKISDKISISHDKIPDDMYLGFYIEEERSHYIGGDAKREVVGTEHWGAQMAEVENSFILDEIGDSAEVISLESLFRERFSPFAQDGNYFLFTNYFDHALFSNEEKCIFNPEIRLEYEEGKRWSNDNEFGLKLGKGRVRGITIRVDGKKHGNFMIFAKKDFLKMNFSSMDAPEEYPNCIEKNIENRWFVQIEDWKENSINEEKAKQGKIGLRMGAVPKVEIINKDHYRFFKIEGQA